MDILWCEAFERQVIAGINGDHPSEAGKDSAGRAGNRSLYIDLWGKAKSCLQQDLFLFFFSFLLHHVLPGVTLQLLSVSNWLEAAFYAVESVQELCCFSVQVRGKNLNPELLEKWHMHCDRSIDTLIIGFLLFNIIMCRNNNNQVYFFQSFFLKNLVGKSTYSYGVKKIPLMEKLVGKILSRP